MSNNNKHNYYVDLCMYRYINIIGIVKDAY